MELGKKSTESVLRGSLCRAVTLLAGPMLISAVLQNAQSLIDLYWVGRLGAESVAALALSGVLLMVLFPIHMGLATGSVAVISRAYGSQDYERASSLAGQSLTLGVVLGTLLGVASLPFIEQACVLLGAEPAVVVEAVNYLRPNMICMGVAMLLFLATTVLQAAGNTVVPMITMLVANLLNIVFDPILIFGWGVIPGYGVAGAAWATVLAQAVAATGLIMLMSRGGTNLSLRLHDFVLRSKDVITLLRIGLPSVGQMSSRSLMNLVFFKVIARFGTFVVAGYGIGMRCHMLLLMPCFVLGNAAATMVGQNLGAGQSGRAQRAAWVSVGMVLAIVGLSVAFLYLLTGEVVGFFDRTPEVVAAGGDFIRIASPFYLLAGISIVLDRALNGAGCTVATMIFTVLALWGLQVPLALAFTSVPFFVRLFSVPVHGVWWAMNTATAIHAVLSLFWFTRGRWKYKQI